MSRMSSKSKKGSGQKRKHRSPYEKWMRFLRKEFGVYDAGRGAQGQHGILIPVQATSRLPPRMPAPRGPAPGAHLTTVQTTTTFNTATAVSNGYIVQNGSTSVLGAIAFRLDDLNQVTTFSSLFDQYRIDEVHLRLRPRTTSSQMNTTTSPNQTVPLMFAAIDRDDSTAPTGLTDVQEYDSCVEIGGQDTLDVVIQPSVTPSVFAGGAFSGYAVSNSRDFWLDVANVSIPHYGIKFAVSPLQVSSTQAWAWDVFAWYKVSFRNVR